jgi:2-succinyl-5-enolpyruvyl-6-hydroxy-3-cyclohexene-1-carboxylate synthase
MGAPTDTYLLLRALVDELARCGLRDACTSPGSRCAPLVLSLAREERVRCHSHIDERCAGFFAVGLAKASGLPVAVACTSGTALAELLPAAVEAHEAGVPLLILSADRPPELRESGAGQTIDQIKLLGGAAKWFFEVGTHELTGGGDARIGAEAAARLRWMRTLACRAYWRTLEGRPGVVHLNFALREPLVVGEGELPLDDTGRPDGEPCVRRAPGPRAAAPQALDELRALLVHKRRGVVVAGRYERGGTFPSGASPSRGSTGATTPGATTPGGTALGEAAAAFCAAAGWPLLADPLSGARRGEAAVAHYDALLRDPAFAAAQCPDVVLRVGDLPTSKPLREWLADLDRDTTRQIQLDDEGSWQDPAAVLTHSLALAPAPALAALACEIVPNTAPDAPTATHPRDAPTATHPPDAPTVTHHPPGSNTPPLHAADPDWLATWRSADERAAEAILGVLAASGLGEPVVAAELGVLLPAQATLFVASSMPVRDIETFWPVRADPPRVLCNRGANGIDGTVSSAFGAAAGGEPVVLLIGDVALAHDIGGLLAARRLDIALTIVLLDNAGGGIFDFLPVAGDPSAHAAEPRGSARDEHEGPRDAKREPDSEGANHEAAREGPHREDSHQDIYTRHIATPTGLDFERAAALYGLHHELATDVASFRAALERALGARPARATIVEVRGERTENVALHRRVWAAVAQHIA